jgi:hypothetical protein
LLIQIIVKSKDINLNYENSISYHNNSRLYLVKIIPNLNTKYVPIFSLNILMFSLFIVNIFIKFSKIYKLQSFNSILERNISIQLTKGILLF